MREYDMGELGRRRRGLVSEFAGCVRKYGLGLYIRGLVSIAFVYFILTEVSWEAVKGAIYNIEPFFLLLFFLLSPIMVLASVWKWYVLLRAQETTVPFWRLVLLYYIGFMFNHILPSSIGGDIVVSYELAKCTERPFDSVASVFMSRFTGIMVLLPVALVSVAANPNLLGDSRIALSMAVIGLGFILVMWTILDKRSVLVIRRITGDTIGKSKFVRRIEGLHRSIQTYNQRKGAMAWALALSFLFLILMVLASYIACLAFRVTPSIVGLFAIIPLIQMISMLPITLGGLGLKEWAFTVSFPQIGIAASVGLSVSLLIRAKGMLNGLIGGVVYPLVKRNGVNLDRG